MKKRKVTDKFMDGVRAARRGSREAELENSTGWKSVRKYHRSAKDYVRRPKHKTSTDIQ